MTSTRPIMIIEDDPDISEAVASILEDRDYRPIVASNGQEGLDRLRATDERPLVILLDLMMPVMDGWQFRSAQAGDPALADIPVVLLSAHLDVEAAARQMSAAAWLRKPVDLQELLDVVARLSAPPANA